jgi:hypothetical protein
LKDEATDNFQASLIRQYQDLIQEAILECETEHRTRLNVGKLNSKLKVIQKAAKCDGIPDATISTLIEQATSPSVMNKAA